MHRKNRTITAAIALLCSSASPAIARSAVPPDPIIGKWYGTAGTELDRTSIGFEFRQNANGEIKAYLYQPVMNFYNLELPGIAVKDSGLYKFLDAHLTVALTNGILKGNYIASFIPVTLKRTSSLPGEVPVPVLPRGPGPAWMAKLGGEIYAPAAIRDGMVYAGSTTGVMNAVDLKDGTFRWMFVAGRPLHGEPLATEEHLYFVCDNGYLFKLDRRSGKEIWRYDLGDERVSRPLGHQVLDKVGIGDYDFDHSAPKPLLVDSVLYVGAGDGGFHAVNARSGERVWRFEGKGKIRATATTDGERVFFGSYDHIVYALDRASGTEVWHKDTRAEITSSPVLIGDRLIVGNRGGWLGALKPATGEVIWRMVFWGSSVESTPAPGSNGQFYIGSSDLRRVSLIDSRDGRVIWRTDIFGVAWPRPAVTDRMVYAAASGTNPYAEMRHLGSLSALDRVTGKLVWRWPVPQSGALYTGFVASPVIEGGTLVIGGLDGTIYGFRIN